MNDDPASSPTVGLGRYQSPAIDVAPAAPPPPVTPATPAPAPAPATSSNGDDTPEARHRRRVFIQTKKRTEFVHDIIVNLDMLIYAEFCYMYYLDCSFFRFLLRAMTQLVFLTPAPRSTPPFTGNTPYGPAILGTNTLCILLHILTARPSAGELSRGYLNGGILVDFIGQKAPSSKTILVVLDLVILALQLFMLAVHIEEKRLKAAMESKDAMVEFIASGGLGAVSTASTAPDYDAEERGVARHVAQGTDGIELLNVASSGMGVQGSEESDALLAERVRRAEEAGDAGVVDVFYTGNVMVGDFHVLETLRRQWDGQDNSPGAALLMAGHTAGYEWTRASQRITRRLGTIR